MYKIKITDIEREELEHVTDDCHAKIKVWFSRAWVDNENDEPMHWTRMYAECFITKLEDDITGEIFEDVDTFDAKIYRFGYWATLYLFYTDEYKEEHFMFLRLFKMLKEMNMLKVLKEAA